MDALKKYFPRSFKCKELSALIVNLIIFIVADAVCGLVIGLLGKLPIIGILFGIVGSLVGIYFFVAIVLAVLNFFGIVK